MIINVKNSVVNNFDKHIRKQRDVHIDFKCIYSTVL